VNYESSPIASTTFVASVSNIFVERPYVGIFVLFVILYGIYRIFFQSNTSINGFGLFNKLKAIGMTISKFFGQIIDITAEGAKQVVHTSADITEKSLTKVQNITPDFDNKINKQTKQPKIIHEADETTSNIQTKSKGGNWCFIGEDKKTRTCMEIGKTDKCMSGQLFPSHAICVNPSLRV
jgi:hypothetical protein